MEEKKLEDYVEQITNHLESEIVKKVLREESTFKAEVDSFYDIETSRSIPSYYVHYSHEIFRDIGFNSSKLGSSPKELVGVLKVFSKEGLVESRLIYEDIRRLLRVPIEVKIVKRSLLMKIMFPEDGWRTFYSSGELGRLYSIAKIADRVVPLSRKLLIERSLG